MPLIDFAQGNMRFQVRVAAVCLHDNHIMLQSNGDLSRWILPGGRGEIGEPTVESVRREMREEFGVEVAVGRLLWVVENFFTSVDVRTHQIGFIYETSLPAGCSLLDITHDIHGVDSGAPFIARWFPVSSLSSVRLLPSFLCEALQSLPETTQHIVHTDVE